MSSMWYRYLVAAAVLGGLLALVQAQEPAGGPPPGKGKKAKLFEGPAFGGGGPAGKATKGSIFESLRDKKVQEEIELMPEQVEELQALAEEVAKDIEPLLAEYQLLSKQEQEDRAEEFRRELTGRLREVERQLDRILLPFQQQRLRQVALQQRMKKAGPSGALTAPDMLRELGISEAQAQRIRESIARIEAEYREKALDLQAEMERKILAQFTPSQQQKLKDMIGPMMQDQPKPPGGGPKGGPLNRRPMP